MNNQLKQNNDICMICLESTNIYALSNCGCKIYIHNDCLHHWIKLYNSCIICRSQLYLFNKELTIRFKYLDREILNSKILIWVNYIMNYISQIITTRKSPIIKYFLLNIFNAYFIFVILLPILIYFGIKSQIKYLVDYYADNTLYGNAHQFFSIKE